METTQGSTIIIPINSGSPIEGEDLPAPDQGNRIYLVRVHADGRIWKQYIDVPEECITALQDQVPGQKILEGKEVLKLALDHMERSILHTLKERP